MKLINGEVVSSWRKRRRQLKGSGSGLVVYAKLAEAPRQRQQATVGRGFNGAEPSTSGDSDHMEILEALKLEARSYRITIWTDHTSDDTTIPRYRQIAHSYK